MILTLLSHLYRGAVFLRNLAYDKGLVKPCRPPVPVVSVGNLSVGGTGKTTLVLYLTELFKERRVCVLMRGYKRKSKGVKLVSYYGEPLVPVEEAGDEAYLIARLSKASVVVAESRCKGLELALRELKPELVLLDDGFQHRKTARDLDLVLLKKSDLKERLLPAGRLREPLSALKRADALVLSYQELEPFEIKTDKPVFKLLRRFSFLYDASFKKRPLELLRGKPVVAFAGLGDNEQFFKTLERLGIKPVKKLSFPDHHRYRGFSFEDGLYYLTTPKDLVKLSPHERLYALGFEVRLEPEEAFKKLLESLL
ncbi:MAG: tetraacyldisaccharide 4'-kinase [Aquificae bacterium]|nr:tetraacyldisaccharide 4'-kinase [Aquificota bacterium]